MITVCDNAAGETCPLYPGSPPKVHWGVLDPALAEGSDAEVAEVFQAVFEGLKVHIEEFIGIVTEMDQPDLGQVAREMGSPESAN